MLGECMAFWGEPNQTIATANTVVINQMLSYIFPNVYINVQ